MISILCTLVILILLIYAAYVDCKEHIIPDKVNIGILLAGAIDVIAVICIDGNIGIVLLDRALAFIIPLILLLAVGIKHDNGIGGGDIKLYASLGLAVGLDEILKVLIVSMLLALIYGLIRKVKYLPMAGFILAGYVICICALF